MKISPLKVTVLLIALFHLGGCATGAKSQAMVVQPQAGVSSSDKLLGTMRVVSVTGGKETNPMWASKVNNQEFREALEKSLNIAGYLAPHDKEPIYQIYANLKTLDQPIIGFTFDVVSTVDYRVVSPEGEKIIPVTATGTAGVSDAWAGIARLRIANERSISENIKEFLQRLRAL